MLTYRQLKGLVPETPRGKMLNKGEILFSSEKHGAKIVIYKNGYLTYTRNDGFGDPCTTAYSVYRCNKIVYKTGCSKSEFDEECGYYGEHCKLIYRIINGQLTRFAVVSEEAYLDGPWWIPIVEICEERIDRSLVERERRRMEPLNDDDYHFMEDESEDWLDAVVKSEQDVEHHERLITEIAKMLNEKHVPTKRSGKWRVTTIRGMLTNEKYTGSCLFQKTYSDFRFNRHRNTGERAQYLVEEHHESIISQEVFDAVAKVAEQRIHEKNIRKDDQTYRKRYPFASKLICVE